jgi:hypothetical protein
MQNASSPYMAGSVNAHKAAHRDCHFWRCDRTRRGVLDIVKMRLICRNFPAETGTEFGLTSPEPLKPHLLVQPQVGTLFGRAGLRQVGVRVGAEASGCQHEPVFPGDAPLLSKLQLRPGEPRYIFCTTPANCGSHSRSPSRIECRYSDAEIRT